MNYLDTVNWMFQQLPMYQNQGQSAYKKDLSNTLLLSEYLNHPEKRFKSIHIAGTNGKGSTCHMIASILQEAGYKVGLYTSPHLKDFRERIKINGQKISEEYVTAFINNHKLFFESQSLSFFEMTVGLAFCFFADNEVDIAIIEVGLGGRLDSTNIITPEISVITNIGLDHTQFLGDSLEAIAKEKGGIIKPRIPIVIGETQNETSSIFKELAKKVSAPVYFADQLVKSNYECDLKGAYQLNNIKTAVQTISVLNGNEFKISTQHIVSGLLNVVANTEILGRWQILQNDPKIVCDTAHNKEGLLYVMSQLENENYENLHIVFGVVSDKDLKSILPILPDSAIYYLCKPDVMRGLDSELLYNEFRTFDLNAKTYDSVAEALKYAKLNACSNDLIFIGGSVFVVAEII